MKGSVGIERGMHRLMPQNAFPNEARHVRHHRIAEYSQALWSRGNPRSASENRGFAYPLLKFLKSIAIPIQPTKYPRSKRLWTRRKTIEELWQSEAIGVGNNEATFPTVADSRIDRQKGLPIPHPIWHR
jgi:hypothetical protein